MNLSEFLAAGVIFQIFIKHVACHLLRSGPVNLENLLGVWVVGVQPSELTFSVPEENKKMRAVYKLK